MSEGKENSHWKCDGGINTPFSIPHLQNIFSTLVHNKLTPIQMTVVTDGALMMTRHRIGRKLRTFRLLYTYIYTYACNLSLN